MTACPIDGCGRDIPDTCYACPHCGDTLRDLLHSLTDTWRGPGIAHDLDDRTTHPTPDDAIPGPVIYRDDPTYRPPGHLAATPLPYGYRASEARWILRDTLTRHAHWIADTRGYPRPTSTDAAHLAQWLAAHVDWLRQRPDGPDTIGDLTAAIRQAVRVVDNPPDRQYAGPCGATVTSEDGATWPCTAELYAVAGRDVVTCRECGAEYDLAARREWLLDEADAQLATAPELARALTALGRPVTERSIQRWAADHRLAVRGRRGGRDVYRVGEARRLADGMRPNRWHDALSRLTA